MNTETYRMRNPVKMVVRDGPITRTAMIDEIVFRRRDEGDGEPNLPMVESCARNLVRLDGSPVTICDLIVLHVEEGMAEAARAASERAGVPK